MLFIESRIFTRLLYDYLNDDEYSELQAYLAENPEAGNIIPGSGGIRKLRWGGMGKESVVGQGSYITGRFMTTRFTYCLFTQKVK